MTTSIGYDGANEATMVVTISYDELVSFRENKQNEELIAKIGAAFGSEDDCLGILAVTDVPGSAEQRQALLPLAAKLPNLPDLDSCVDADALYSVGWSHGKEEIKPGTPDLNKGSFYANPLVDVHPKAEANERYPKWLYAPNVWPPRSLPTLEPALKALGSKLFDTGVLLAAVCDAYCQQQLNDTSFTAIQDSLRPSLNSKARLLHYFAPTQDANDPSSTKDQMWCAWHNDHGSLTGLAPGMFLEDGKEVPCPDDRAGLYIQTRGTPSKPPRIVRVKLPAGACAFQIGETSQVMSGGILQATPHAVVPSKCQGSKVTRESFAVFLEPEFEVPMSIPPGKTILDCQQTHVVLPDSVTRLDQRWKPGQTFGDFHLATLSSFNKK